MPGPPKEPPELRKICDRWADAFEKLKEEKGRIEFVRHELPELLLNGSLVKDLLTKMTEGGSYPDIRQAQMFDDEILLHLNPKRLFSIRMFLYGPGDYTPIHDHSSWGVSGSALGNLGVLKYCREDDGSADGYARLIQTETLTLTPGETDVTFPLDRGIHQTGNPTENTIIMISIYGSPMRRLYVNRFDLRENRIFKLYPPRLKKKMLAAQALKNFKVL